MSALNMHTASQRHTAHMRRHLRAVPAAPVLAPTAFSRPARSHMRCRAQNNDSNNLEDYVEVKVDSVRVAQGSSVVFLRILDGDGATLPVHIGESESSALMKEISNQRNMRPITHDVTKSMLLKVGFRVSKIRITEIVANTYYARIHLARNQANSADEEVDVDARPSDAINLAVRFGAPMFVNKKVAEAAAQHMPAPTSYSAQSETNADIVKSIRQTLSTFDDPTIMVQLQKELAIKEDRFEDAQVFQEQIAHEMTHNPLLRLVVAMETALNDGRFDEAARLRDEYNQVVAERKVAEHKYNTGL